VEWTDGSMGPTTSGAWRTRVQSHATFHEEEDGGRKEEGLESSTR